MTELTPAELEALQREISGVFGMETIPPCAEYLLEYKANDKIHHDIYKSVLVLFKDSNMRDAANMTLSQKLILVESLRLYILRENTFVDHKLFRGGIYKKLTATREIFLDLQNVLNYQKTRKEKFKLTILRKYGPLKDVTFKNPFRDQFAAAFRRNDFKAALEIILMVNFRKITGLSGLTKEYLDRLETELLTAGADLQLDTAKIRKSFQTDAGRLNLRYEPLDPKKFMIIE